MYDLEMNYCKKKKKKKNGKGKSLHESLYLYNLLGNKNTALYY